MRVGEGEYLCDGKVLAPREKRIAQLEKFLMAYLSSSSHNLHIHQNKRGKN